MAAGLVPMAHAGDGGGSIRIPASACGLVGLKPSRGRHTNAPENEAWAGLVARNVVSRSVRDTAAALDAIAGPAPGDPYQAPPPARPYVEEVGADPGPLRVGWLVDDPGGAVPTEPACADAVQSTLGLLEGLGHRVEDSAPDGLKSEEVVGQLHRLLRGLDGPGGASGWRRWSASRWSTATSSRRRRRSPSSARR